MKSVLIALTVLFFFLTCFTFCKKETTIKTIHDTTTIHVHDTLIVIDSVYDLSDGLVAYYNFIGGSTTDGSQFQNNIIFNNAVQTSDRFGTANNAYTFDGSSSYMRVANSPSLNPDNITIFAVVKVNGFNQNLCHINQILGKGSPDVTQGFYSLRFDDWPTTCISAPNTSTEFFYGQYGDNNPQGSTSGASIDTVKITTGQWYNVVYTFDGNYSRLYVNGKLKDQKNKPVPFTDNTNDVFIGRHQDPTYPYYFNGVIDEIRIYNRALPDGAIKQLNNLKQ
jgi:hypothetical protein